MVEKATDKLCEQNKPEELEQRKEVLKVIIKPEIDGRNEILLK